jgi:hypothetical protein
VLGEKNNLIEGDIRMGRRGGRMREISEDGEEADGIVHQFFLGLTSLVRFHPT